MANEFHYSVSLSIVHPSIDPKLITDAITELNPTHETMAGTERYGKAGKPLVPSRKAMLSHWLAELHQEKRLYSGDIAISDFILERLTALKRHRNLFAELRRQGRVVLLIGWFSDSSHSATLLDADTLRKCGDLGIDLELNFYGPDTPLAAPQKP